MTRIGVVAGSAIVVSRGAASTYPRVDLRQLEAPDATYTVGGKLSFGNPTENRVFAHLEVTGDVGEDGPGLGSRHGLACRRLRPEVGWGRSKQDRYPELLYKGRHDRNPVTSPALNY